MRGRRLARAYVLGCVVVVMMVAGCSGDRETASPMSPSTSDAADLDTWSPGDVGVDPGGDARGRADPVGGT